MSDTMSMVDCSIFGCGKRGWFSQSRYPYTTRCPEHSIIKAFCERCSRTDCDGHACSRCGGLNCKKHRHL